MEDTFEPQRPTASEDVPGRLSFDDKTCLVTGGGGGIGRQAAFTFADRGASIAIAEKEPSKLDSVVDAVEETFEAPVSGFECDVTDPAAVDEMVEAVRTEFETIDVLVNVVGGSSVTASSSLQADEWDRVQNLNLRSAFLCSRAAYPSLEGGGAIVNVSSIAGVYGSEVMSHYASAKGGIVSLTRSLGAEWGRANVRVNAVAPGPILTGGTSGYVPASSSEIYDREEVTRPAGSPAEVADTILFLASDLASYVSGQTFVVNGTPTTQETVIDFV